MKKTTGLKCALVVLFATVNGACGKVTDLVSFMANPPPFEIAACVRHPKDLVPPTYFLVRYQNGDFFYRFSPEKDTILEDSTFQPFESASGRYDGGIWLFAGMGQNSQFTTSRIDQAASDTLQSIDREYLEVIRAIYMGGVFAGMDKAVWTNDECAFEGDGAKVTAKAFRDQNGLVERIEWTRVHTEGKRSLTNRYKQEFTYSSTAPTDGLPASVQAVRYAHDGRVIPLFKLDHLWAHVGTNIPAAKFMPRLEAGVRTMQNIGGKHFVMGSRGLEPVLSNDDPRVKRFDRRMSPPSRWYYFLGAASLLAATWITVHVYVRRKGSQ